jgi:hypothetical protein
MAPVACVAIIPVSIIYKFLKIRNWKMCQVDPVSPKQSSPSVGAIYDTETES